MLRELERTAVGLGLGAPWEGASGRPIRPPSRTRAIMQITLTALLVPLCLWALFGSETTPSAARNAASALLGAIVTFWLKD